MKVGDYVRTKWGYICKIVNINDFREPSMKYGVEASYLKDIMFIGDEDILKSSPNIIDLIEAGDYVNGSEVCKIYDNNHLDNPIKEVFCMGKDGFEGELIYTNDDIKSIVTREQFKAMQYKVGEQ